MVIYRAQSYKRFNHSQSRITWVRFSYAKFRVLKAKRWRRSSTSATSRPALKVRPWTSSRCSHGYAIWSKKHDNRSITLQNLFSPFGYSCASRAVAVMHVGSCALEWHDQEKDICYWYFLCKGEDTVSYHGVISMEPCINDLSFKWSRSSFMRHCSNVIQHSVIANW